MSPWSSYFILYFLRFIWRSLTQNLWSRNQRLLTLSLIINCERPWLRLLYGLAIQTFKICRFEIVHSFSWAAAAWGRSDNVILIFLTLQHSFTVLARKLGAIQEAWAVLVTSEWEFRRSQSLITKWMAVKYTNMTVERSLKDTRNRTLPQLAQIWDNWVTSWVIRARCYG